MEQVLPCWWVQSKLMRTLLFRKRQSIPRPIFFMRAGYALTKLQFLDRFEACRIRMQHALLRGSSLFAFATTTVLILWRAGAQALADV